MVLWYFYLLIFILGLVIGSFLNVVVYRVPRGASIIYPPSTCPKCHRRIAFYDNIPLLSFVLLRGRCRACQESIALRYPAIELVTGCLFLALAVVHGPSLQFLRGILFVGFLIPIAAIDWELRIIPDQLSLPGTGIGLLSSLLVPGRIVPALGGLGDALLGAAAGAGLMVLLRWLGRVLLRREALGPGDITLGALIGSFLGLKLFLLSLFIAALLGTVTGLLLALRSRRSPFGTVLPFGPFLAVAALITHFFGMMILDWYQGLFGLGDQAVCTISCFL